MKRNKYSAKKTPCQAGHIHASKKEAKRCDQLHVMQRAGEISRLQTEVVFRFVIDGVPIKMGNGQVAKYTADFMYWIGDRQIIEEVKGFVVRDFPLRIAIFKTLFPYIEVRIVK